VARDISDGAPFATLPACASIPILAPRAKNIATFMDLRLGIALSPSIDLAQLNPAPPLCVDGLGFWSAVLIAIVERLSSPLARSLQ
jgi:hypothetical protein